MFFCFAFSQTDSAVTSLADDGIPINGLIMGVKGAMLLFGGASGCGTWGLEECKLGMSEAGRGTRFTDIF